MKRILFTTCFMEEEKPGKCFASQISEEQMRNENYRNLFWSKYRLITEKHWEQFSKEKNNDHYQQPNG